ncbi:hypothetical protein [Methylobacterium oryzihabitans]|uniref:Uncharacterized protein n=1 Tax=Methylobacterium oryzihabitans TaxID=2499852 RepID=A0A437NZY9_9HYPH|nr:hypothetical protein [Methylobacterium oryzihabitans]RVU15448.1 hypothetical protein EOE48_19455 [Methylobacterium oryzihabitans]
MDDLVPTPPSLPPPTVDPVQVAALARAAALIVGDLLAKGRSPPGGSADIEATVRKCVVEFFKPLGFDLDDEDDFKRLRATLEFADRRRTFWERAQTTGWNAICSAIRLGMLTLALEYLRRGK